MESGVHGVESEAAVCPGRRISGASASRWTSCGAGTGATDTLEGVAGIMIAPEQPQSLPKALLRHPTVRYRASRPPRRSPGLAHFVIPRPGLRQTPRFRAVTSGSPAPFTLRHGAKQLTQFTTARPPSPAPLAGSRCSRPSARPAPLACGPGRPAPLLPLALRLRLPLPALLVLVAACLNVGTRERSRGSLPWGDRPRVLKRLVACLG